MTFIPVDRSDNAGAFGIEYLGALYRYALMLTRNTSDAEDLVQETYIRALEARQRLSENSNLKSWLHVILRNIWLNQMRKRKTAPRFLEVDGEIGGADDLPDNKPNSEENLIEREDAEKVQRAISQLSVEFREIIMLREFEDFSYQEIASVLSCPAGTVMSRLGRARAKLRSLLTEVTEVASKT